MRYLWIILALLFVSGCCSSHREIVVQRHKENITKWYKLYCDGDLTCDEFVFLVRGAVNVKVK